MSLSQKYPELSGHGNAIMTSMFTDTRCGTGLSYAGQMWSSTHLDSHHTDSIHGPTEISLVIQTRSTFMSQLKPKASGFKRLPVSLQDPPA